MKEIRVKTKYGYSKNNIVGIHDITDDSFSYFEQNKTFANYKELYKDINTSKARYKMTHKRIAITIFRLFLEELMNDLIYNNVVFVFPIRGRLCLSVNEQQKKAKYNIETRGMKSRFMLNMSQILFNKTRQVRYYVKVAKRYYEKIQLNLSEGHTYPYLENYPKTDHYEEKR